MNRFAAYRALLGFTCQAPVFALFYLANGLDYRGLMTLAVAFAGALATGVFVLGPKKGMELVEKLEGVQALIVAADGGLTLSKGLRK